MEYDGYKLLRIQRDGKILTAIIDAPPINVMTMELFGELARLSQDLERDPDTLVFLLKSADPDFFIAHFDVSAILSFPIEQPPSRETSAENAFHAMCARFASMNKVTIAQIEGRVGGGGSELSMNFDMRFGVRGRTIVNQMEVPLGIIPGGSGTQMMPRLIGRNRAMEVILGGIDLDADTAERWGYLNRALEAAEINSFVSVFAHRIASFPTEAVRAAKKSICSVSAPMQEGLAQESHLFQELIRTAAARSLMQKFLNHGGQTREVELNIATATARFSAS